MKTYVVDNNQIYSDRIIYGTVTVDDDIHESVIYAAAHDALTAYKPLPHKARVFDLFLDALLAHGVSYSYVDFEYAEDISLT